jgi:hypothetical protein
VEIVSLADTVLERTIEGICLLACAQQVGK